MKNYLIIGGVAGGATTAARLRRNDEEARIVLFERGEHISYANCGLPYYVGGVITDRSRLFVQTPESFALTFRVEVKVRSEVVAIDRQKKQVQVRKLPGNETWWEPYDKLVLSPGAEPVRPPLPGMDAPNVFTLRNVEDTDRIKDWLDTHKPRRAAVIGAGFIGLEMAENLHHRGMHVSIVEMAPQVMVMLDPEIAAEVHQHFKTKGVATFLGDGVKELVHGPDGTAIKLNSGKTVKADVVIMSVGVRPETSLARDAGLEIGEARGIKVNPFLQTSDPDIYAVGDAIEFPHPITGRSVITYLAGPANKQGRICADNIVKGNKSTYKGSIATAIAKIFDLTVASTGLNARTLQKEGIPFRTCVIHGSSHAGYYPDAMAHTYKLLFGMDGRILGAQGVGYEGIDKRIDMMATLLGKNGTIQDLTEVEHAYAPPYSSAKDPVNILGFVAQNILEGNSRHITWDELKARRGEFTLVDVRLPEEFGMGSIEGALNVPIPLMRERMAQIPKDKPVVLFCGVGLRAYLAERILKQHGYDNVWNLSGGYKTWEHATACQSNEDVFQGDFVGPDSSLYQADPGRTRADGSGSPVFNFRVVELDATGLQCPGPIMKLKGAMDELQPGERLKETASDPGFAKDVVSWCRMTGNRLVEVQEGKGRWTAVIEKGGAPAASAMPSGQGATMVQDNGRDTTLIVFSDDMDKALASLVIANGAASAGKKVTMFFTFWGLNVIKRKKKPRVKKDFLGKMFGFMLPKSLHGLKLSKLNMGGMGAVMMKGRMKSRKIDSLQEMLDMAIAAGVRLVACNMSMDVMGVNPAELVDGVELGGVAAMLDAADTSRATFFI